LGTVEKNGHWQQEKLKPHRDTSKERKFKKKGPRGKKMTREGGSKIRRDCRRNCMWGKSSGGGGGTRTNHLLEKKEERGGGFRVVSLVTETWGCRSQNTSNRGNMEELGQVKKKK